MNAAEAGKGRAFRRVDELAAAEAAVEHEEADEEHDGKYDAGECVADVVAGSADDCVQEVVEEILGVAGGHVVGTGRQGVHRWMRPLVRSSVGLIEAG